MTQSSTPPLRTLGNSDLQLTPIGFGAWAIGGANWEFTWGPQDDNESIAAIHRALDLGINWIDTAAIYGLGHSEEVVGRALKSSSQKPYIFTKCSMRWHPDRTIFRSLRAGSLAEELDGSLRRLGVETIDLYQIHWPNPEEEIEEGWETLARFREQGKIRWSRWSASGRSRPSPACSLLTLCCAGPSRRKYFLLLRLTASASSTIRPWYLGC